MTVSDGYASSMASGCTPNFDFGQKPRPGGCHARAVKLKTKMYWAALPIAALLLAGVAGWNLLPRAAPVAPVAVTQGEVEVRVAGPGTVQARVPVTVAARLSAQVLSVHADHGQRVKRGQLLA